MRFFLVIFVAWLGCFGMAQAQSYEINIHGTPYSCTAFNGQPVPIYTDPNAAEAAQQLGGARVDLSPGFGYTMALHTGMLSATPPRSAVFVFFHECGHAALPPHLGLQGPNAQFNADCWAIQQMVAWGLVQNWWEFEEAVAYLRQIGWLHGITQARIQYMQTCI